MAKIVFWNPFEGMVGCTHTAIAISSVMGITHKSTCLLMHGNFDSKKIESSYTLYENLKDNNTLNDSSLGISPLVRLLKSNKLTPEAIQNYAKPVLKGRLDILYGMDLDTEESKSTLENIPFIMKKANEVYDVVLVDLPKTAKQEFVKEVIANADVVVIVLNQDSIKIDDYFKEVQNMDILKNKTKLVVIGDYEDKSKYNLSNIKFKYHLKDPLYAVPHNYQFVDACNEGNVLDYLYRNINAEPKDYNGYFISQTSQVVEKIVDIAKIKE